MRKDVFLETLQKRLSTFSEGERKAICDYYAEMIDDRIEEGMEEEAAVADLGELEQIVEENLANLPFSTLMKVKVKESRQKSGHKGLWIVLAILGSPLWICLLLMVGLVWLSVYLCAGALLLCVYVFLGALLLCGAGGLVISWLFMFVRSLPVGICLLGMGLILAGVGCLLVQPVRALTRWAARGNRKLFRCIKSWLLPSREVVQ